MTRSDTLHLALQAVCADREATHGPAGATLGRTAALWSAFLGMDVAPYQVAAMLALVKLARLAANPGHGDSWVDLAGYAAIGAEIATEGRA